MDWAHRKPITLMPHSGIQFLTFGFDIDSGPPGAPTFIERPLAGQPVVDGLVPVQLLPAYNEIDPERDPPFKLKNGDDEYDVSRGKAMEVFVDRWVPLPYFAVRPGKTEDGLPLLDRGPSNWARAFLMTADKATTGMTHTVVFAFDTQLVSETNGPSYSGLRHEDAINEREFIFAHRFDDLGWFFSDEQSDGAGGTVDYQQWLSEWLRELFFDFKMRKRPTKVFRAEELEHKLEHIARYIAFLKLLDRLVEPGSIRLIDTVSEEPAKPVSVDFILDIGNSRTCGILIESSPGSEHVDLGNSMVLQLRDLSRPDITYSEPFESHVELAQAHFGPESLSRRSGRPRAFLWPSLVRVGPEAARFRELAEGTEKTSGMSSPKRYLWDTNPVAQPWSFQPRDYPMPDVPPLIQLSVARYMNPRGDVLAEVARERGLYQSLVPQAERGDLDSVANQLTFSRSSFFTLMVGEIIAQALSMINNYQVRQKRAFADVPRRLNRLILTLPTAMPVREQRIMRSRVNAAISLVWDLMRWPGTKSSILRPPELIVRWDEASCVQFVYLYTEIVRKSGGDVPGLFDLVGRPRAFAEAGQAPPASQEQRSSLRVASVDIGGGTTDLMITTYYSQDRFAILPSQTFRESFRIAGDDVLKAVIEQVVLPCFEIHLSASGVRSPREYLNNRFGGNRANMSEQDKHLRQQFVLRVLHPLGLELLRAFESAEVTAQHAPEGLTIRSLIERGSMAAPSPRIEAYLVEEASRMSATPFSLRDVPLIYDFRRIRDAVVSVLDDIFNNIAEVLNHFDCDVVLLAGRPSRLPAAVDLIVNKLPVAPDRIIPMHEYRVGAWYPFKTRDNVRISDPKTATVVGGMLCALAQRQINNLTIDTDRLTLRSTASFLGVMENSGKIKPENELFGAPKASRDEEATVTWWAPMRIGYRQLPHERWTATPLYKLSLGPGRNRTKLPLSVILQRGAPDEDVGFEEADKFHEGEARKEEIKVVEAQDRDTVSVKKLVQLSLDTMAGDDGYWLDTGILTIN